MSDNLLAVGYKLGRAHIKVEERHSEVRRKITEYVSKVRYDITAMRSRDRNAPAQAGNSLDPSKIKKEIDSFRQYVHTTEEEFRPYRKDPEANRVLVDINAKSQELEDAKKFLFYPSSEEEWRKIDINY